MANHAVKDDPEDKTTADSKAAAKVASDTAKKEADERAATKSHLNEILILRGLARAASPHGAENLAAALDNLANALAAGLKIDDTTLVDVAITLKDAEKNWDAMVKRINDITDKAKTE